MIKIEHKDGRKAIVSKGSYNSIYKDLGFTITSSKPIIEDTKPIISNEKMEVKEESKDNPQGVKK